MLTGRVVPFCREAIKAEKPNKVKCDADEIDIFRRQDVPLSVPAMLLFLLLQLRRGSASLCLVSSF
eukprot:Skav214451  [mRNA]  locus=scaffold1870:48178:48375:+ [translate_table: standard]